MSNTRLGCQIKATVNVIRNRPTIYGVDLIAPPGLQLPGTQKHVLITQCNFKPKPVTEKSPIDTPDNRQSTQPAKMNAEELVAASREFCCEEDECCFTCITGNKLIAHIEALESENERLREALEEIVAHEERGDVAQIYGIARQALTQIEEKP